MVAGNTYQIKVSVLDDDNTFITSCKQNVVILDKDRVAVNVLMTSPQTALDYIVPDIDNIFSCEHDSS